MDSFISWTTINFFNTAISWPERKRKCYSNLIWDCGMRADRSWAFLLSNSPCLLWRKFAITWIFSKLASVQKWRIFRVPYPGLPKDVWNCTRPDVDLEMPKVLHDRLHVPKMVYKRQLYSCHQTGIFKAAFEDDIEAVTEFIEKETHLSKLHRSFLFTEFYTSTRYTKLARWYTAKLRNTWQGG